jgi:pimeloyl-ACP methyl ester carboxylesterase
VPETSSCWRDVAPRLAAGRRVLAPDLPGLGGSSYTGPYDVASVVGQLAALVDAEVPGGRIDVVGHDWGGSLALALAGARPELVRRIVVANAPFRDRAAAGGAHPLLRPAGAAPSCCSASAGGAWSARCWRTAGARPEPLDDDRRAEYEAAYTTRSVTDAMLGYYRQVTRPRIAALVRRDRPRGTPRVRAEQALVLWGAADPSLPVSTGESVVRDLGADCVMVTLPGVVHFVVEEAAETVTQVLLDFLADATTPPPPVAAAPPQQPAKESTPLDPPPDAVPADPVTGAGAVAGAGPAVAVPPVDTR